MAVAHENIADPYIHEPKGVATASADTVYVADGAGSGTWQVLGVDSLDLSAIKTDIETDIDDGTITVPIRAFLTAVLPDISTPGSSVIIPLIQDCTVIGATTVLEGAITAADASVSFLNSAGASMGTPVTVAFTSSAKGDQNSFTATGNNTITGPSWIEVTTDGGSTDAQRLFVTIEIQYQANAEVT